MSALLDQVFARQLELQIKSFGVDPQKIEPTEAKPRYVLDMALALEDELHEALAETGWKPWATKRFINRDACLGELIDALHFFTNLLLAYGVTPKDFAEFYEFQAGEQPFAELAGHPSWSDLVELYDETEFLPVRTTAIKDGILTLGRDLHAALMWLPNMDVYYGHMVMVLQSWTGMCRALAATEEELLKLYLAKADKNAARQAAGYDGVAGKCPRCWRAYDDDAVQCRPARIEVNEKGVVDRFPAVCWGDGVTGVPL